MVAHGHAPYSVIQSLTMETTMSEAPGDRLYLNSSPLLILGLFSVTQWLDALPSLPTLSTSLLEPGFQSCNLVAYNLTVTKRKQKYGSGYSDVLH